MKRFLLVSALVLASCGRERARPAASTDLLTIGYDREPDTMNRYARAGHER